MSKHDLATAPAIPHCRKSLSWNAVFQIELDFFQTVLSLG